jgi:sterol desaturase/sphingolipid hydroxylase (fatty acid hydroxylase superfamily)
MFDSVLQVVAPAYRFVETHLLIVLNYPFDPGQRIFWLYVVTSTMLAFYAYHVRTRSDPVHRPSVKGFVRFLFPNEVWRSASAWLDVRYFFFHQIVRVVINGALLFATMNLVFQWTTGGPNLIAAGRLTTAPTFADMAIATAYMFVLIGVVDFVAYAIHYLQHKVPVLWEFHKVHHSLEVMHPLSNYREHPIDNIFYAVGVGATYGLIMGLANALFGYVPGVPQLLGVPLVIFAFNFLGYNLRHSHIWLRWPGRWAMAFASPAHHHVHHSCHPDHVDKNFAFIFPLWDVLFRTYELPETNEDVRFGLAADDATAYKSCLGLYFLPFRNLLRPAFKGSARSA